MSGSSTTRQLGWPARLATGLVVLVIVVVAAVQAHRAGWLSTRATIAGKFVQVVGTRQAGEHAAKGAWILAGQRIELSQQGLAEIELRGGGRLRISPGAALSLEAAGEQVDLRRGMLWAEVDSHRGRLVVRTPQAVVEALGTSFVVEQKRNVTEVRVMRGVVAVHGDRPEHLLRVQSQQQTRVVKNRGPEAVGRYRPEVDQSRWLDLAQKLGIAVELRRGLKQLDQAGEDRPPPH